MCVDSSVSSQPRKRRDRKDFREEGTCACSLIKVCPRDKAGREYEAEGTAWTGARRLRRHIKLGKGRGRVRDWRCMGVGMGF